MTPEQFALTALVAAGHISPDKVAEALRLYAPSSAQLDRAFERIDGGFKCLACCTAEPGVGDYVARHWRQCRRTHAALPNPWIVGDKVTTDGVHRGHVATITGVFVGFHYKLDEPHDLGPRHGTIDSGTAYDTSGWRLT